MNTSPDIFKKDALKVIIQLKEEKLISIQNSQQRITTGVRQLLNPSNVISDNLLSFGMIASGVSIIKGFVNGFKILRRIIKLFH